MQNKKRKIYVALSGGVDSAVTAHLLHQEGWQVTGVFIRVWQPDFLECSQDEEERAAKRVAAHLGIPFKRLDLSQEYKKEVVDIMIEEYQKGRTPNPDVLCNATIKFGAFLQYALTNGADKIATGHHARVFQLSPGHIHLEEHRYALARGVDASKDQAYFLWKLTQEQLSHTLMPIGEMQKSDVRVFAEKHNIPSAHKPDSQGLCFIGHVDMKAFLGHFFTTQKGKVLNIDGEEIGEHDGAELVTLGQRGGFTLTTKNTQRAPLYVVAKNVENNTITVSEEKIPKSIAQKTYELRDTNWSQHVTAEESYTAEIRYHGTVHTCSLTSLHKNTAEITFTEPLLIAQGQSVVVYKDNICLGGGIV